MIAFTFPGQGSQKPGMGEPWHDHPSWELVDEASAVAGRDVAHLLLAADADELRETRNAQLATYVAEPGRARRRRAAGRRPARVAGHSLGEYTALTAAGVLSFADGVRLVTERGEAMQVAAAERAGTMAAVLGPRRRRRRRGLCHAPTATSGWPTTTPPGRWSSPAPPRPSRRPASSPRSSAPRRVLPLEVGGAFHTPFMASARDRLRKALAKADLRDAELPVLANVDARPHITAAEWANLLAAQLCSPVRWRQILHALGDEGVDLLVELGAGHAC